MSSMFKQTCLEDLGFVGINNRTIGLFKIADEEVKHPHLHPTFVTARGLMLSLVVLSSSIVMLMPLRSKIMSSELLKR